MLKSMVMISLPLARRMISTSYLTEPAMSCSLNRFLEPSRCFGRALPPALFPKWLAVNVAAGKARPAQRGVVHVPHRASRIEESTELEHVVESDAREQQAHEVGLVFQTRRWRVYL